MVYVFFTDGVFFVSFVRNNNNNNNNLNIIQIIGSINVVVSYSDISLTADTVRRNNNHYIYIPMF